jgi:hypothetical protein
LRGAVKSARRAFLDALDVYSLAELVRPQSRLRTMLAIAPAGNAHAITAAS